MTELRYSSWACGASNAVLIRQKAKEDRKKDFLPQWQATYWLAAEEAEEGSPSIPLPDQDILVVSPCQPLFENSNLLRWPMMEPLPTTWSIAYYSPAVVVLAKYKQSSGRQGGHCRPVPWIGIYGGLGSEVILDKFDEVKWCFSHRKCSLKYGTKMSQQNKFQEYETGNGCVNETFPRADGLAGEVYKTLGRITVVS